MSAKLSFRRFLNDFCTLVRLTSRPHFLNFWAIFLRPCRPGCRPVLRQHQVPDRKVWRPLPADESPIFSSFIIRCCLIPQLFSLTRHPNRLKIKSQELSVVSYKSFLPCQLHLFTLCVITARASRPVWKLWIKVVRKMCMFELNCDFFSPVFSSFFLLAQGIDISFSRKSVEISFCWKNVIRESVN